MICCKAWLNLFIWLMLRKTQHFFESNINCWIDYEHSWTKKKIASGKVRLGLSKHWKGSSSSSSSRKINSWLTCSKKIRILREGESLIDVNCVQFCSLILEIAGDEKMSCRHTWDEFNDGEQTTLNNCVNL